PEELWVRAAAGRAISARARATAARGAPLIAARLEARGELLRGDVSVVVDVERLGVVEVHPAARCGELGRAELAVAVGVEPRAHVRHAVLHRSVALLTADHAVA